MRTLFRWSIRVHERHRHQFCGDRRPSPAPAVFNTPFPVHPDGGPIAERRGAQMKPCHPPPPLIGGKRFRPTHRRCSSLVLRSRAASPVVLLVRRWTGESSPPFPAPFPLVPARPLPAQPPPRRQPVVAPRTARSQPTVAVVVVDYEETQTRALGLRLTITTAAPEVKRSLAKHTPNYSHTNYTHTHTYTSPPDTHYTMIPQLH